jgi:hypothetical protein
MNLTLFLEVNPKRIEQSQQLKRICLLPDQSEIKTVGATARLGAAVFTLLAAQPRGCYIALDRPWPEREFQVRPLKAPSEND